MAIKKYILLSIFLLLSVCTVLAQNPVNSNTTPKPLKILSWNIYMLPAITSISSIGKTQKLQRTAGIVAYVQKSDYDIIVWQESFHIFARKKLKKELKKQFPYQYGPANKAIFPRTNSGIQVFSKMPLNLLKEIEYTHKTAADAWAKKGALMLEGQWEGNFFQIIGTHLQAENTPKAKKIRTQQLRQLKEKLAKPFEKKKVPQIICGDLNINYHSQEFQEIIDIWEVNNYELKNNIGTTFRNDAEGAIIDYIFLKNNGLKLRKVERSLVIPEIEWGKNGEKWLSDHHAIEAIIQF